MRLIAACTMAVLISVSACADDTPLASPQKVDLSDVVASGKVTAVDGITTAGQPDADALRVFADNGYKAVIDLRTPSEERGIDEPAVAEELGMRYISMPVDSADITYERAAALDEMLAGVEGPILLHCASSNRVGALLALRASAKGMDDEAAIEIGKRAGLASLEPVVRKALADK